MQARGSGLSSGRGARAIAAVDRLRLCARLLDLAVFSHASLRRKTAPLRRIAMRSYFFSNRERRRHLRGTG